MAIALDLTGVRFGRLTVMDKSEQKNKGGTRKWRCLCDCGNEVFSTTSTLNAGKKLSCGCIKEEQKLRPGDRFGMLTVLEITQKSDKRGRQYWVCRCDCGGEKEVTAHNLKRGRTTHCGCQRLSEDLTGKRFGKLIATRYTEQRNKDGKRLWRCVCDCGGEKLVPSASLKNGSTKSCGCLKRSSKVKIGSQYGKLEILKRAENKNGKVMFLCRCECGTEKEYPSVWLLQGRVSSCGCSQGVPPVDLKGKRFGHIVAKKPTDLRDGNAIVWECRCDCGNTTYRSHSNLKKSGENTNCGCRKTEISRDAIYKAQETMGYVENTSVAKLEAKDIQANNKSGVRGVFYNSKDQKWRASIGFQRKQIYLGQYDTLEEAAAVRKRAEEEIYKPFLEKYYSDMETDEASSQESVIIFESGKRLLLDRIASSKEA